MYKNEEIISDKGLRCAAYWLGYARARYVPRLHDSNLDKNYPYEYEQGFEDGYADEQDKAFNPVIGVDADPQSAYEGKIICCFPMWENISDRDYWSLYIHDQDLTYAADANEHWSWSKNPDGDSRKGKWVHVRT